MTKNKGFITIPSATAEILFKSEVGIDALVLYSFLQHTAIWQHEKYGTNNRPFASRTFCKKALHWGTDRYRAASKVLTELGLKRARMNKENGKAKGLYTELPFVNLEKTSTKVITRKDLSQDMTSTGSPNTDSKNTLNTDTKIFSQKESVSTEVEQDWVRAGNTTAPQTISNLSAWAEELRAELPVTFTDENLARSTAQYHARYEKHSKAGLKSWLIGSPFANQSQRTNNKVFVVERGGDE